MCICTWGFRSGYRPKSQRGGEACPQRTVKRRPESACHPHMYQGSKPARQGHSLALTVLCVPRTQRGDNLCWWEYMAVMLVTFR